MRINPYIVLIATSGLMLATVAFAQPAPASHSPGDLSGSPKDVGSTRRGLDSWDQHCGADAVPVMQRTA